MSNGRYRQNSDSHSGRAVGACSLETYLLEEQVGFLLRKAHQRATAIFVRHFGRHRLTPRQWTTLVRIYQQRSVSQNHLGRLTAMDPATVRSVVERLLERGLVTRLEDARDGRRKLLRLTPQARRLLTRLVGKAFQVTRDTLSPLSAADCVRFLELLLRLT